MTYIYGLKDPNTNEIRYIGKSDNPKARFQNHMALSKADVNRHKKHWIAGLIANEQKPQLVIIEKEAARASVALMRGYFKGATDGDEAFLVSRAVIRERLSL